MALILRKCLSNGKSSRNFYYGQIGDTVICPDWNPFPECGNGLHGLLEGNGDWGLLVGTDWLVIEAEPEDIVNIDEKKCKFRIGKILFRGSNTELANSELPSKFINLNSENAYWWALDIGNRDIMINKIVDSEYAYLWALNIGNRDVMINKITDSWFAYLWACYIGNRDIMMHKITDSRHAFLWAKNIGNEKIMKPKITVAESNLWNKSFPYNPITT